ncbi:MAG: DUF58 domain-containing protein [Actinobacteria bacterium]|nr:DUF58 domain-containing protein [Actinomycetota bacterium]
MAPATPHRSPLENLGSVARSVGRALGPVAAVVSPAGRSLAIVTIVSWWLGRRLGWIEGTWIAATGLVLLAMSVVFLLGASRLSVELVVQPQRVTAGDTHPGGRLVVSNPGVRRTLPQVMESRRATRAGPRGSISQTQLGAAAVVFRPADRPPRRHRGGPGDIGAGDPLGLLQRRVGWTESVKLYVHPRTVTIENLGAGFLRDLEGQPTVDLSDNDVAFHALREYQPGDDRRFVHWKSTARAGKLMVRQFVDTRRSHLAIILDTDPTSYDADGVEFEHAVSIAGSLGLRALRDEQQITMRTGSGPISSGHGREFLDGLAGLALARRPMPLSTLATDLNATSPEISTVVLLTGSAASSAALQVALTRFGENVRRLGIHALDGGTTVVRPVGSLALARRRRWFRRMAGRSPTGRCAGHLRVDRRRLFAPERRGVAGQGDRRRPSESGIGLRCRTNLGDGVGRGAHDVGAGRRRRRPDGDPAAVRRPGRRACDERGPPDPRAPRADVADGGTAGPHGPVRHRAQRTSGSRAGSSSSASFRGSRSGGAAPAVRPAPGCSSRASSVVPSCWASPAGRLGWTSPIASSGLMPSRVTLREQVEPPFDPTRHPSPLAGFRHYTSDEAPNLRDETVFTVTGMPKGESLRLAIMDSYDGIVWQVGGDADGAEEASGLFRRIGERIDTDVVGDDASVRIEVGAYNDIWLPTVGTVTSVHFEGSVSRRDQLTGALRFNRSTNVGAIPRRLQRGDVVDLDVVVTEQPEAKDLLGRQPGSAPNAMSLTSPSGEPVMTEELSELATVLTGDLLAGYDVTAAIATAFATTDPRFGFSDGNVGEQPASPGHYAARLRSLALDAEERKAAYGNGEQYAAAHALMSRKAGVPSRVVMGFCPPPSGCAAGRIRLQGSDIAAWTEVSIDVAKHRGPG